MSRFVALLCVLVSCLASGCGSDSPQTSTASSISVPSALLGTWYGRIDGHDDTMNITADGKITSSYCGSATNFTVEPRKVSCSGWPDDCGYVTIHVEISPNIDGCFQAGQTARCYWDVSGGYLNYNCGGATITYHK